MAWDSAARTLVDEVLSDKDYKTWVELRLRSGRSYSGRLMTKLDPASVFGVGTVHLREVSEQYGYKPLDHYIKTSEVVAVSKWA